MLLEYKGESKNHTQWAKQFNVDAKTVLNRINRGWTVEESLLTPPINPIKIDGKTKRPNDPEVISLLTRDITTGVLGRFKKNLPHIYHWIDETSKTDPEKVTKVLSNLGNIFDKFSKYLPEHKKTEQMTLVNISLVGDPKGIVDIVDVPGRNIE